MKYAFMDTSGLVGFLVSTDGLHQLSTEVLRDLTRERYFFYTNQWVEYEVLTSLKPHGHRYCVAYTALRDKTRLQVHPVTAGLERQAVDMFWAYQDKSWGIVDCVSICQLRNRQAYTVYGCDEHFSQAGLLPLMKYDDTGRPTKGYARL